MSYQEYLPSTSLSYYIDAYWVSKNDHVMESRILPDTGVDIVFDISEEADNLLDNIRISGMMTRYRNVVSKQNTETYGIRFKAGLFNAISNFPLSEIKNRTISASEILPKFNNTLLEQLIDTNNQFDKIRFLEDFLMDQLNWSNTNRNNLISAVCIAIDSSFKTVNLVQIANQHHVSLRQLERRFKAAVGATMKEYHSIVRFNRVIKSISENPEKSLLHTAFDNGYFDHAHLTRDIKKIAGMNPSQF